MRVGYEGKVKVHGNFNDPAKKKLGKCRMELGNNEINHKRSKHFFFLAKRMQGADPKILPAPSFVEYGK